MFQNVPDALKRTKRAPEIGLCYSASYHRLLEDFDFVNLEPTLNPLLAWQFEENQGQEKVVLRSHLAQLTLEERVLRSFSQQIDLSRLLLAIEKHTCLQTLQLPTHVPRTFNSLTLAHTVDVCGFTKKMPKYKSPYSYHCHATLTDILCTLL